VDVERDLLLFKLAFHFSIVVLKPILSCTRDYRNCRMSWLFDKSRCMLIEP
jgi:hypothetical protein